MCEILEWSYIPYRLGHYWWKSVATSILNRGIMISHEILDNVSPWVILRMCDPEIYELEYYW